MKNVTYVDIFLINPVYSTVLLIGWLLSNVIIVINWICYYFYVWKYNKVQLSKFDQDFYHCVLNSKQMRLVFKGVVWCD